MAAIFTEDLVCTFFQVYVQMDSPEATSETLAREGIEQSCDLGGFSKEGLDSDFNNLRYPPRRMTYPDVRGVLPEDLVGVLVDVHPFQISSK